MITWLLIQGFRAAALIWGAICVMAFSAQVLPAGLDYLVVVCTLLGNLLHAWLIQEKTQRETLNLPSPLPGVGNEDDSELLGCAIGPVLLLALVLLYRLFAWAWTTWR